jgi:molecular chaperone GrpE
MPIKKLKTKVRKNKVDEIEEIKSLLLRVQADFDNYRKRTQTEKEDFAKYVNTDLVLRILPVLDNFKLALKHQPKDMGSNSWAQGIWHIERQLEQILTDEGLTEIPALGHQFNPHLHEAIEEVESKKPPGEIIEVIMAGYRLGDKVIRHAKVKVSKLKEGE